MNSRERVQYALNHQEPDRVPLFIGTSGATSLLGTAYENLKAYLGMPASPTQWLSLSMQYASLDEEILQRLGSDGRPLLPGPSKSTLARVISDSHFIDDYGIPWKKEPGTLYFDSFDPPLRNATLDDLETYPFPDLTAPERFAGLAEKAKAIQARGYATVMMTGINIFEQAFKMRGLDTLLEDMILNEEFFAALMTKLKTMSVEYARVLTKHVGPHVDVFITGDDLGSQDAPMISPAMYRKLIKPHQAEMIAALKTGSPGKVFFHSCGNIFPLLDDLADIGVDLLNPVQVSAKDMGDTARLKAKIGNRMSFCGAIDTRWVLPHGSTDDVRAEVRRRIRDLAPGGGYIAASVHCIQPDVPPENVLAMCDEVRSAGQYPIRV